MIDITPETLRGFVDVERIGTHWEGCWSVHRSCAILAAADAWEADLRDLANLRNDKYAKEDVALENFLLRARLAEAEAEAETERDRLWCRALTNTLPSDDIERVTRDFNRIRPVALAPDANEGVPHVE